MVLLEKCLFWICMWSWICEVLFPKRSISGSLIGGKKFFVPPNLDYGIPLIPDKPEDAGNILISFVWSPPGGWKSEHKPWMELEESRFNSSQVYEIKFSNKKCFKVEKNKR